MSKEVEGSLQVEDVSLYTKSWIPDGELKANLIFVHGLDDHINRYYILFPYLASRGIAVHGFDQRGWGRTAKQKSDWGLTGPTTLVTSDIVAFINSHLPSKVPLFVAGHSMGGGEILTLASDPTYQRLTDSVRGWILESPFIDFPKGMEPNFLIVFFGKLGAKVFPGIQMACGLPPENLTRDPAVVKSLQDDELLRGMGTLQGLAGLLDRTAKLNQGKAHLNKGIQGLWLGHGTADKGTGYEASKEWFERQTSLKDKEFKTYEGWYHQLHADLPDNREAFAKDVSDWILARCGPETVPSSKF